MNRCKRIAALVLSAVLSLSMLVGCAGKNAEGMALPVSVGSRVTTLDPIYAEDLESQNILVHLYENLLRVAPDGNGGSAVVNGMAKDVDVEENNPVVDESTVGLNSVSNMDEIIPQIDDDEEFADLEGDLSLESVIEDEENEENEDEDEE